MLDLTFGEQVKIILSRKGMTIKELAETIEERTGKKMSRQNLTQRLGRDNFQEQDMRMIAEILECPFQLNILVENDISEKAAQKQTVKPVKDEKKISVDAPKVTAAERDVTIGELVDIHEELDEMSGEEAYEEVFEEDAPFEVPVEELLEEMRALEEEGKGSEAVRDENSGFAETKEENRFHGWKAYLHRRKKKTESEAEGREVHQPEGREDTLGPEEEMADGSFAAEDISLAYEEALQEIHEDMDMEAGEINPYTGLEYESNSVRIHPARIGYVQVYDRTDHKWTDMTEWAFLGYQERKKALLGNDYEPPIYLD